MRSATRSSSVSVALRQKHLDAFALGHIAQQHHVDSLLPDRQLRNRSFGGKFAAVLAQREYLLALAHAARGHCGTGEGVNVSVVLGAEPIRDEQIQALPEHLVLGIAENGFRALVELSDAPLAVQRNDGIGRDCKDRRNRRLGAVQLLLGLRRAQISPVAIFGLDPGFSGHCSRTLLSRTPPRKARDLNTLIHDATKPTYGFNGGMVDRQGRTQTVAGAPMRAGWALEAGLQIR